MVQRTYKLKRIVDPTDSSNYVDIPVIADQWFMDMVDQAQDWRYYFDNTDKASGRDVNVVTVHDEGGGGGDIRVERIKSYKSRSMVDQAQEWQVYLTNEDEPPKHYKTHVVQYFQNNDSGSDNWVKVQYIDEAILKTMADQAQESHFILKQPTDGTPVDLTLPKYDLSDTIDPPYRTDPWQNIIAVHWGGGPDIFIPSLIAIVSGGFTGKTPDQPSVAALPRTAQIYEQFIVGVPGVDGLPSGFFSNLPAAQAYIDRSPAYTVGGTGSEEVAGTLNIDGFVQWGTNAPLYNDGPLDTYNWTVPSDFSFTSTDARYPGIVWVVNSAKGFFNPLPDHAADRLQLDPVEVTA